MGNIMSTQEANNPARSVLGSVFHRAKSAFSGWSVVRQLDSEEAVARDLNISPTEFVSLMFTSAGSQGLSEERLAASHPDELRDLCRVCSPCNKNARRARVIRRNRLATAAQYSSNQLTPRSLARAAHHDRMEQLLGAASRLI